ncbi:hypothetical protein HZH66_014298 [Vespula vulgaris]|uniref:Uncharacterized protein n=1 Tax=Vespula vulgaris TaxID=7454 RepID=A0A834J5E4_VESVU|nr:hypothetical protein HZH66_014298 [Vespula vulgaris]
MLCNAVSKYCLIFHSYKGAEVKTDSDGKKFELGYNVVSFQTNPKSRSNLFAYKLGNAIENIVLRNTVDKLLRIISLSITTTLWESSQSSRRQGESTCPVSATLIPPIRRWIPTTGLPPTEPRIPRYFEIGAKLASQNLRVTLRLRQKELLLQEGERTICEREEILRADTVQPDLATLETLREIVTMRQHANDAYYDLRKSHNIFIQRTINMVSQYDGQDEISVRYGIYELTENKRNEIDEFTLTSSFCDVLSLEHSLKINPDMYENLLDAFVLNEEHWIDTDGSENYWFVISSDSCGFNDVLYEGSAVKLTSVVMTEGLLKDFHNFSIYKSTATV